METHNHSCNCNYDYGHKRWIGSRYRWLLILFLVSMSFLVMKPFVIKQLLSRASSYMTCGLYSDAVRMYKKAIFIDKRNAYIWDMLGYTYQRSGNLNEAAHSYNEAIKIDPTNKSSHLSLGLIFASEKKYAEAIPHFEQIRAFGPDDKSGATVDVLAYHRSSLKMLIICYDALKEIDKKNGALKELMRYYPNDNSIKDLDKKEGLFKR